MSVTDISCEIFTNGIVREVTGLAPDTDHEVDGVLLRHVGVDR